MGIYESINHWLNVVTRYSTVRDSSRLAPCCLPWSCQTTSQKLWRLQRCTRLRQLGFIITTRSYTSSSLSSSDFYDIPRLRNNGQAQDFNADQHARIKCIFHNCLPFFFLALPNFFFHCKKHNKIVNILPTWRHGSQNRYQIIGLIALLKSNSPLGAENNIKKTLKYV